MKARAKSLPRADGGAMRDKNSISAAALDVVTNGRDYMRAEIVQPTGQHELSWYQRVEGGGWERKVRPLTDEEAAMMQRAFQAMIRENSGAITDDAFAVLGLERGQDVSLYQLTMVDKSKL
jgi:hypothetical protein